ncbi:RNA polymerase sigma factor [Jiangella rhizosphaerae]|uniref:RNA polymerase sigma factor n=1 Tax=Jiangella rhizosphaerae TaxID=2293569 RepID=UPI001F2BF8C1|nr:sigma factor-like helix-turn-helix DNA-binding protein [Jiangella rhizosphaerae]
MAAALAELPARQRVVITLRDVHGYDSAEVCSILEISMANQRVLLHRARAAVRLRLERYFHPAVRGEEVTP